MKTLTTMIVGALLALSFNINLSAQSGVVIESGPKAKAKAEAGVKRKQASRQIVIRSADGGLRAVEIDGAKEGVQMIDLGDGRRAMISIETQGKPGHRRSAIAIQQDDDDCVDCEEIEDCEERESCEAGIATTVPGAHAFMIAPGHQDQMIVLGDDDCEDCEGDDCCEDIEIELGEFAPMIGQLMEHVDLSKVGPMIGAMLGDEAMDLDIEIENGKLEIDGKAIHDLLAQHMGHGEGHGIPELLAMHLGHGKAKPGHQAAIRVEVSDDDDCECECECPCCKAGKCALPSHPHSGPPMSGKTVAPKGNLRWSTTPPAPHRVTRRRIVTSDDGGPQTFFVGPKAGAVKKDIRVMQGGPATAPQRAIIRRLQKPTEARPARPAHPSRDGDDLGDIEHRIDRLAEEMRALQGELRALRRKI